jgi:hypothetical protein
MPAAVYGIAGRTSVRVVARCHGHAKAAAADRESRRFHCIHLLVGRLE